MLETLMLLKERTEIIQQHALSLRQEAAAVRAMRKVGTGSSLAPLSDLRKTAWKALRRIEDPRACCPKCELPLQPFPPRMKVLLTCPNCGFVAKSLETRRAHA